MAIDRIEFRNGYLRSLFCFCDGRFRIVLAVIVVPMRSSLSMSDMPA